MQAVTELGGGFWVLTPLRHATQGFTVLVNRGFVAARAGATAARARPASDGHRHASPACCA